jgi:RimJ/RimL family protein N-acetyltransferase
MFPFVTHDDIFRLETERLSLRWPRASDVKDIAGLPSLAEAAAATSLQLLSSEAEHFVLRSRAANADGKALILAITQKGIGRTIGIVSATQASADLAELGYVLAPNFWGRGFATEAAKTIISSIFSLTGIGAIIAKVKLENGSSCHVLEKCGFSYAGPAGDEGQACGRFLLDRGTWARRREGRLIPPAQRISDWVEPAELEASAGH